MRRAFLVPLLLLAACGGSDPKTLTDEGYAALGKGDAKAALARFEKALEELDASKPDYLRAALGRCDALASIDQAAAKVAFLDLAKVQPARVIEDDYSRVCARLLRAQGRIEAVEIMHAGMTAYPESERMKQTKDAVIKASKESSDPEALARLRGLGYVGD